MPPVSEEAAVADILITDDDEAIGLLFARVLEHQGHHCVTAGNAADARERLGEHPFQLVLCDVQMPGESGLDLARWIAATHPDTAILMASGLDDREVWTTAIALGAFGYLTKPVHTSALVIGVENALRRVELEREARVHQRWLEATVQERTAELRDAVGALEEAQGRLAATYEETVRRLAQAAEYRDTATGEHVARMSTYCALLSEGIGLEPDACERLRLASLLHDVGKIAIPDAVLLKAGPLDDDEWNLMRRHAELGHALLDGSESDLLSLAASVALTHHERLDGSGYPNGLAGSDIPVEGRIAAVADVLDAVTSDRCYQRARPFDEAVALLESGRGVLFEPGVVDVVVRGRDRFAAVAGETAARRPRSARSAAAG